MTKYPRLRGLTRSAFKQWLSMKNPNGFVGMRGYAIKCPITQFIRSLGYEQVFTFPDAVLAHKAGKQKRFSHPKWTVSFINKGDRLVGTRMRASTALRLLAQV